MNSLTRFEDLVFDRLSSVLECDRRKCLMYSPGKRCKPADLDLEAFPHQWLEKGFEMKYSEGNTGAGRWPYMYFELKLHSVKNWRDTVSVPWISCLFWGIFI